MLIYWCQSLKKSFSFVFTKIYASDVSIDALSLHKKFHNVHPSHPVKQPIKTKFWGEVQTGKRVQLQLVLLGCIAYYNEFSFIFWKNSSFII